MQWDVQGLLTRYERLGSTFIAVLVPVVSSVSDVILRACVRGCSGDLHHAYDSPNLALV